MSASSPKRDTTPIFTTAKQLLAENIKTIETINFINTLPPTYKIKEYGCLIYFLTSTQRNGVNTIKEEGPAFAMRSVIYHNYVIMLTEVENNGLRKSGQVNSYFKQAKASN